MWFISLPMFLSHCNKDLERGTNNSSKRQFSQLLSCCSKYLKQQTVTAQLQLKQIDLLLNTQRLYTPEMWDWTNSKWVAMIPLGFPFYIPSPPLGFFLCKMQRSVFPRPIKEGEHLGTFKRGIIHIHLSGPGLRVLIDSCKLHNNRLYYTGFPHNSVCYNQMCTCIEYLWTLNGLLATPKATWGHNCASGENTEEFEKPLWLVCIHSVPRAHL